MLLIILLAIVLAVGYRVTTAEDRARFLAIAINELQQARAAAARSRVKCEPYHEALRERTRWAIATSALVGLNVLVFVLMLRGDGALSDPLNLVAWGASVGPRTTNGEWWRLVTSLFVHASLMQLLLNMAALLQLGLVLERLVGWLTFTGVYIAAGLLAGLTSISAYPVAISFGASASIFALYGLLLASTLWGLWSARRLDGTTDDETTDDETTDDGRRPTADGTSVTMSPMAAARLAPLLLLFILYNVVNSSVHGSAEWAALAAGFICGLALTRNICEQKPAPKPIGIVMGVAAAVVVALAIPLRRIADVKPEIARVIAVEGRTAGTYRDAADRLKKGQMTADALAQLIDRTIVPELLEADARLKALERIPQEHKPLVDSAEEYLRLRSESWRLRADGLRKTVALTRREAAREQRASDASWRIGAEKQYRANLVTLGKAEGSERASLEALQVVTAAMGQSAER